MQLYKRSCTIHTHVHKYSTTAKFTHTHLHPSIIAQERYAEVGGIGGDLERGVEGTLGGRGSELDGERSVPVRLGGQHIWTLKGVHLGQGWLGVVNNTSVMT